MKNAFVILIILNSMLAQSNIIDQNSVLIEEDFRRKVKASQTEIYNLLPEMKLLEKEYATDVDIQLGLAILYKRYPDGSANIEEKIKRQWEKVLSLDPSNKIALATITNNNTQFYMARYSARLDDLESLIESAQKRGVDYITIQKENRYAPTVNSNMVQLERDFTPPLYKYFSEGNNEDIVIRDYEEARRQLKEKLKIELSESIEPIRKSEQNDTGNALYNYLEAEVYFGLSQNESGLEQVRIATQKQYLKTYLPEIRQAVSKVLVTINFPEQFRSIITSEYAPFGQFITGNIITKGLEPLLAQYKEQGKSKSVEEIFNMTSLIAEQIRKEPMPYPTAVNRYGDVIERWVNTSRNDWAMKRTEHDGNILAQNNNQIIKILLISTTVIIIIAAGGILLYKKKTKLRQQ